MMSSKSLILLLLTAVLAPAPATFAAPPGRNADQEQARQKMLDGKCMPFAMIKKRVDLEADDAAYLGVELLSDGANYRLKYVKDGKVIWFDVDCRTGDIRALSR
jgi:ABC-type amino acid transport substrate-binding protein